MHTAHPTTLDVEQNISHKIVRNTIQNVTEYENTMGTPAACGYIKRYADFNAFL